jgi:peptidoglycan-associated lipoprotein
MQSVNLKQLRTLGLVLACGALAAGCAGNSAKPMEQHETEIGSVKTDKAVVADDNKLSEQAPLNETDNNPAVKDVDTAANTPQADTRPQSEIQPASVSEQPKQVSFYFGFDKSSLASQDRDVLKQHAAFLKNNPMLVLDINGHTDSRGPRAYNEYLSKQRAEAVAKILIAEGVSRSQLVINALADDKPQTDSKDPGKNRRVDLQYEEVNQVSSK